MDNNDKMAAGINAYANGQSQQHMQNQSNNPYADNYAHREHNPYGKSDPYKNNDVYAQSKVREKKRLWEVDFEIIRFFRENYNAGIDFEESPRNFFDEEYMLAIRLKLLGRNFKTMLFKFFVMTLFSVVSLFLAPKGVIIFGAIYIIMFLYFIAVPIGFVKYARQYVVDDTESGKLKKVHSTYAKWLRPLEVITMNTFTIIFLAFEAFLFIEIDVISGLIADYTASLDYQIVTNYVSTLTVSGMKESIFITSAFYVLAYLIYWLFIYKFWTPKWEAVRAENEKLWTRTNQRTAVNLRDELTKTQGE